MTRLLISSGEASGDLYAAELVRHLAPHAPGLDVFGLGGDRLAAQGAHLLAHARELAVVGLLEVVTHLRRIRRVFHRVLDEVDRQRPDAAVLIDYPDFNLRLARQLAARGVPVLYYVSPQVWAWRRGRLKTIRETVARMIVIFPFEERLYREAGVPVTFVGHPLVDLVQGSVDRAAVRRSLGLDPGRPLVALLPGSRAQELAHHLPRMLGAVRLLRERRPDLQFALALAPSLDPAGVASTLEKSPVEVVAGRTQDVLSACTAAVVASGTATVEATLLRVPMVVVYHLSPVTYVLGRRFVSVPHYAMVNLIAERRVVTELIQGDFTPRRTAAEVLELIQDEPRRQRMLDDLDDVRRRLGGPGASARAAEQVLQALRLSPSTEKKLDKTGLSGERFT
jgi:lipid-A-disaccharide synthase